MLSGCSKQNTTMRCAQGSELPGTAIPFSPDQDRLEGSTQRLSVGNGVAAPLRLPTCAKAEPVRRKTNAELIREARAQDARRRENAVIRKIVQDPVACYAEYHSRLRGPAGHSASFPEFAPLVEYLLLRLQSDSIEQQVRGSKSMQRQRQFAMTKLCMVNLKFEVAVEDYPYPPPFQGSFPYRATLEAIRSAVEFFDCLAQEDPEQDPEPLYHVDRYGYYWDALVNHDLAVLFPTISSLGFNDLITVRAVPIGFLGVSEKTLFVDRHRQSPADFLIHDVNHMRRMLGYDEQHLRCTKVQQGKELEVFLKWNDFIQKTLMPLMKIGGDEDEDLIAHLVRLIIFEILHESALSPTANHMLSDLKRTGEERQPFEHMRLQADVSQPLDEHNIEQLRTELGNLNSGLTTLGFPVDSITIRYFRDRAVVLLGNVYNKMVHGFYDEWFSPKKYVCKVAYRTPGNLARAAHRLLTALGAPGADLKALEEACVSQRGSEEKFKHPRTLGAPRLPHQNAAETPRNALVNAAP